MTYNLPKCSNFASGAARITRYRDVVSLPSGDTAGWPQHLIDAVKGDFKVWPMVNTKRDPLPGADDLQDEEGKIKDFDPKPYG